MTVAQDLVDFIYFNFIKKWAWSFKKQAKGRIDLLIAAYSPYTCIASTIDPINFPND